MKIHKTIQKGFTLIELLVVIAVLGVLAGIILVAVNPSEQLKRGRDTTRISGIRQLGSALAAYYTNANAAYYPVGSTTWQSSLTTSGDLANPVVVNPVASGNCTLNIPVSGTLTGLCYTASTTGAADAVIWTNLESANSFSKGGCSGTQVAVAAFVASQGKAGIGCIATATTTPLYTITLN